VRWTTKARVHRVTSAIPMGHRVNLVFQRRITHTYPRSDQRLGEVVDRGKRHVQALVEGGLDPAESTFFEFGAGWDLAVPLTMAALGAGRQVVVDLNPLLRPELVDDVAARLRLHHERFGLPAPQGQQAAAADQLAANRIDYRAPCDARATGLPAASIDAVTSTSTLEHIPAVDIDEILTETTRILRPGGLLSFEIDYSDHYSHGDRTISPYNFLRFGDDEWRRYNPSLHFQNRLRHPDYLERFVAAGLEVVSVDARRPDAERAAQLDQTPLAPRFTGYARDDLAILEGWFLLRRP
jgi:SAM-dependent methyltransferase